MMSPAPNSPIPRAAVLQELRNPWPANRGSRRMTPPAEVRQLEGLECASRRLRAATRGIGTARVLLLAAHCSANRVQNAESDRDASDGEPESQQLPRQILNRVHAQILRARVGRDRRNERLHERWPHRSASASYVGCVLVEIVSILFGFRPGGGDALAQQAVEVGIELGAAAEEAECGGVAGAAGMSGVALEPDRRGPSVVSGRSASVLACDAWGAMPMATVSPFVGPSRHPSRR